MLNLVTLGPGAPLAPLNSCIRRGNHTGENVQNVHWIECSNRETKCPLRNPPPFFFGAHIPYQGIIAIFDVGRIFRIRSSEIWRYLVTSGDIPSHLVIPKWASRLGSLNRHRLKQRTTLETSMGFPGCTTMSEFTFGIWGWVEIYWRKISFWGLKG